MHNSFTKNNAILANQKPVSRRVVLSPKPTEKPEKPQAEMVVPSRPAIQIPVTKRKNNTSKTQPIPKSSSAIQNKKAVLASATKTQTHPHAAQHQSSIIKVKPHPKSIAEPRETSYGITHSQAHNETIESENGTVPVFDFNALLEPMPHEVIGLREDEITELARWDLWENELPGEEPQLPNIADHYNYGTTELSTNDGSELSTNMAIIDILGDNEFVESRANSFMGTILVGAEFEIVELVEDTDNSDQPATLTAENQAVRNELMREVRPEVGLLESFGQLAVVAMESLEPAQAETAQIMFETIVLAVHQLQMQPELVVADLARQEKELEQLCIEFLSYIDINYEQQTARLYLQNIKTTVATATQKNKLASLEQLTSLGAHEHKFGHKLSLSNLIRIIKKQLQQQLRLGKYVVQTSIS